MSTATMETETPSPSRLRFTTQKGHDLLYAVSDAILQRRGIPDPKTDADEFVFCLRRAAQRLDRASREAGVNVEEDAMRAALEHLEPALEIRGHRDDTDKLINGADIERHSTLSDHLWAASELLDWAVAGCREGLAELEDDG